MSASLRVIAGTHRGRILRAPAGRNTRPTSARVREALFGVLGSVDAARVLDLYAGSGALAIEALSRGAAKALLVEHDRSALACIRTNLEELKLADRAFVLPQKVTEAAGQIARHGPFDLVLCDPPWSELERAAAELSRLSEAGVLAENATLALEHAARDPTPGVNGLTPYDRRAWGDTAVSLFCAPEASGRQT